MNQVAKVCRQLNRKQGKNLITECCSSGMTVKNWCKANGVCEQSYYRNLKILREDKPDYLTTIFMPDGRSSD